MEELLSLKWNNHRSTFLHILGVLRDKQAYTDVTLACDGKFYSVHKLVLSTCSDYFCAMFEKTACKSPVIVLKDIKNEDLEALLDYMYLGEVNVRQSDLASLIKAAENLRIKGLAVPDDEPPPPSNRKSNVGAPSRRDGGGGSPPTKRKRRDESEDGREDVRPTGGELHTPPPPSTSSRPKSPGIQRLSPSPHRTSQESRASEDRDNRPLSSPLTETPASHAQASSQQSSLQSAQQLGGEQVSQQTMGGNQFSGGEETPYVKVEMDDDETDVANRDTYNISSDSFKEEGNVGGELSNDLPEFLQQAASSALAGTSVSYHQSFAGPSGFQPEVSSWHGDGQSLPGNFPGIGFPPTSQENPPGIGAELHGNVCKVCGKVFNGRNWKQNLEYHFLTHTKEKPFKCPICPHSSALKYNLIRHIRNRHWEVLAPTILNTSGEREGPTEPRNSSVSNREVVRPATSQEVQQLPSERVEMAQLPASLGGGQGQSQQESHLNMNQNFQMALSASQDAQMPASNSQVVQIAASGSSNQVIPMAGAGSGQLSQMAAAAATIALSPMNVALDIPISTNQEMQVPLNRDAQLSAAVAAVSQGSVLLTKEETQMLMKKT